MKSPMQLWKSVADELATLCSTSATRDIEYVSRRSEHEGFSFLAITLPTFGKDTQKCLDQGYVDRNLYQGFPWQAGLPRLFGGFLDLVFDRSSGELRDDPSIDAIFSIRQLSLMFGKTLHQCTKVREEEAIGEFVSCERDVRTSDANISAQQWADFERVGSLLFGSAFREVDRKIYYGELVPKHGPGATADRLRGNAKYRLQSWPARLESVLPFGDYALPNWRYADEMSAVDIHEPDAELPSRVVTVPKTLKTPRVIAIEPTAMQYGQQAIARSLVDSIESDPLLSRMISFTDQTLNQRMAEEGSRYGHLATLDLSEASDRVSNQHVRHLVSRYPNLHQGLDATRSRKADVPGFGVIRLAKFASMGSALCFPVEMVVFMTIIFMAVERKLNSPLSRSLIKRYSRSVRVFGDDIIVPSDCASFVTEELEAFGFRVNRSKSFWSGKFRESCGKEYYDGFDVSISKYRRDIPTSRMHADGVNSYVVLRNQLYQAGLWKTCAAMDAYIRKVIKHYPVVAPSSPLIGRFSFLGYTAEREHPSLHSPLVKGWEVAARSPEDPLDGYAALLKCLLLLEEKSEGNPPSVFPTEFLTQLPFEGVDRPPTVNAKHLERAGRPHAVTLKLRWGSPF